MKHIHKWRTTIFCFSLACALAFVLLAFGYTVERSPVEYVATDLGMDTELEIIRTVHRERQTKVPPPPWAEVADDHKQDLDLSDPVDVDTMMSVLPLVPFDTTVAIDKPVFPNPNPPESPLPPPDNNHPINLPDKMPFFGKCFDLPDEDRNQCSAQNIYAYLRDNIKYPAFARANRITGSVHIQFVVDKEGNLRDFQLIRDIGGGCGEETLRALLSMPKWSPGVQNGRPVAVIFQLPVHFVLE